jgi:hypothetical protein
LTGAASLAASGLALVFLWASAAKAIRFGATAHAFGLLGLPAPRVLAAVVPAVEVVIAALLLGAPQIGGALALAALAAFTLVIVRALGTGAPCSCFGSASAEPVSPADVVRNGLLAAFAAVATGTSHLVSPGLIGVVGMVVAVALAVVLQAGAHRRLGPARR